jgi:rubredoxin
MLRMCATGFDFLQKPMATIDFHCSDVMKDTVSEARTWMCLICGWIYEESAGDPEHGIAPGTAWADVPMNWTCPECGARKEDFEMVQI